MSNKYINPSGFTENLPNEQIVEDRLKDIIAKSAELYGYSRIETASVEYMDTLVSEGEVTKEIYTIGRAQAEGDSQESDRGLHFDLTVPFARYVAQNQGNLQFPFRRYQIQKVWRGERPQKGRFREFYQADIDVVAQEVLSPYFDAEVASVVAYILDSFEVGTITIHINNRKFLNGLLKSFGITMNAEVLQIIDKIDKIGILEAMEILKKDMGYTENSVTGLFKIISTSIARDDVASFLETIGDDNLALIEGKTELLQLFSALPKQNGLKNITFVLNPRIARGLDYYTGSVYESTIDGLEKYGSICSGGRYADLASRFTNQKLPGVGLSIGLSRLLSVIKDESLMDFSQKTKSQVVICLLDESQRTTSLEAADFLRRNNINVEMNQKSNSSLGKQLSTAELKGVKYALVCEKNGVFTVYEIGSEKFTVDSLEKAKNLFKKDCLITI